MPSFHCLVVCGCKKYGFAQMKELEIRVRDFQLIIIVLSIWDTYFWFAVLKYPYKSEHQSFITCPL